MIEIELIILSQLKITMRFSSPLLTRNVDRFSPSINVAFHPPPSSFHKSGRAAGPCTRHNLHRQTSVAAGLFSRSKRRVNVTTLIDSTPLAAATRDRKRENEKDESHWATEEVELIISLEKYREECVECRNIYVELSLFLCACKEKKVREDRILFDSFLYLPKVKKKKVSNLTYTRGRWIFSKSKVKKVEKKLEFQGRRRKSTKSSENPFLFSENVQSDPKDPRKETSIPFAPTFLHPFLATKFVPPSLNDKYTRPYLWRIKGRSL